MGWMGYVLASAVFLALYDLTKKASVRDNAVLPVLLIASVAGFAVYAAGVAVSGGWAVAIRPGMRTFALTWVKTLIVSSSWVLTYCALRTLPISIATPIRASSPAWVFLAALFLYGERPNGWQALGMLSVFAGYFAFSWAGRYEGIDFFRNRAVWLAVGGMLLSAVSGLWDKYLLQVARLPKETMQFWFQLDLAVIYALYYGAARLVARRHGLGDLGSRFQWRWTIPFVGILLAAADWFWFAGLAPADVPVSIASLMRRVSVVLTIFLGARFFHEKNLRRKTLALAAVLFGVALLTVA
ncbi:MAG: DMT family transporter [Kiritimatiellae bacterium]|nr:DMT family transporter [Kiritimatiellia bacterium]